ncbi:MAG TPA: sigma-70 family RNA polymerase sigma factor [Verrucomicrobiae bacterium]|nr:sigma-70 family RNA polymerase sigma factor [Verrucomicrobiae bacterium]
MSDFTSLGYQLGEMQPKSDAQLLRDYAQHGVEAAFTELVQRHTNLVYSAALRQVESPDVAAEIAQNVFIGLARSAKSLSTKLAAEASLAGWLCRSARNLSLNHRRDEFRRLTRERHAMEQLISISDDMPDWEHLRHVLDDAMSELGEADYDAIVLRYFQKQDFRTVGAAIGVSDDTAQKRVTRALDRLRDLLSQRGIRTTAATLGIVISTNAVQAAPVGLAATISTAAAIAGSAFVPVATAATTKVIAMTTMQKTIVTATVAVLAGAGLYEAHQNSKLRHELRDLEQQQTPLQQSMEALGSALIDATNLVAGLRAENDRLNRNTAELLKLRSEVGRLRNIGRQSEASGIDPASDQTTSTAMTWVERVAKLKQRIKDIPETGIPELSFLNDEDWLAAVHGLPLESETDYRLALSNLRRRAEHKAGTQLQKALREFTRANNHPPTELSELQPYVNPPIDHAILGRWMIADKSAVPNVQVGQPIITQKAPVDEVFDQRMVFSADGGNGATDFLTSAIGTTMQPVYDAYRTAHNGQWHTRVTELLPYAATPEQQVAVQKLILRAEARQPKGQ